MSEGPALSSGAILPMRRSAGSPSTQLGVRQRRNLGDRQLAIGFDKSRHAYPLQTVVSLIAKRPRRLQCPYLQAPHLQALQGIVAALTG